jgi:hypothetical protein
MNLKTLLSAPRLIAASVTQRSALKSFRHKPSRGVRTAVDFHCVSIKIDGCGCFAGKQLQGKRFLSAEAPLLPLPGCADGTCKCRYEHHNDRRHDLRRNPFGARNSAPPEHIAFDRRFVQERRKSED